MPRPPALAAALALFAAAALPAAAGDWVVTLHNGTEFVSRYQPEEASWDPEVVLLMTADGNTIGLARADVASVASDIESRGFGTVIDDKTISLGWAPNDLPDADAAAAGQGLSPEMQILQQMIAAQNQQPPPPQTVQQFVDPGSAGGGLPAFGTPTGGLPPDFGAFDPAAFSGGAVGIVSAPPSTSLPIPQAGSLPAQGSAVPGQSSAVPVQSGPGPGTSP
jgi:hypothetical protein